MWLKYYKCCLAHITFCHGHRVVQRCYEPHKTIYFSSVNKQHVTDRTAAERSEPLQGDGTESKWGLSEGRAVLTFVAPLRVNSTGCTYMGTFQGPQERKVIHEI